MKRERNKLLHRHDNSITAKILELYRNGEFIKALQFIKEYNIKYPKDIKGKYIEGKLLRINGNLNESKELLESILPTLHITDEFYCKVVIELLFTEVALSNYENALHYLDILQDFDIDKELEYVDIPLTRIFILNKLGRYNLSTDLKYYNHNERQILEFSKEEFFNNILAHTIPGELSQECFYKDIDYLDLYDRLEKVLPYAKKYVAYSIFDYYIFKVFPIGTDNQGEINHIRLSTFVENDEIKIARISLIRPNMSKKFINNLDDLELKYLIDNIPLKKEKTKVS